MAFTWQSRRSHQRVRTDCYALRRATFTRSSRVSFVERSPFGVPAEEGAVLFLARRRSSNAQIASWEDTSVIIIVISEIGKR